jgi:Secretion system C-terminal sorting domain
MFKTNLIACLIIALSLYSTPSVFSQTTLYSDDFETPQTWTIFEELVSMNPCYGASIGEVARSTDVAHGGTNSLRVWSNKNGSTKSNHVIAAHHISNTGGITGRLRYGLWAYTGTTLGLTQSSPEFSVQSTRTVGGQNLTYIAGIQYIGNQWVTDKWNIWHNGTWKTIQLSEFGTTLAANTWYYLELEFDMTTNRYIQLKVVGGTVNATLDLTKPFSNAASGFQIGAEARGWTPSYFVTLESENLWSGCTQVHENKTYYDNIRLEAVTTSFTTGTTYYGSNNYVEYRAGSLPIIISAPHDGTLEPTDIPDRTCAACTIARDLSTRLLAEAMSAAIEARFGCKPHLIFTTLHRKKLDANREIGEASLGNLQSEMAWQDYHNFIEAARKNIIGTQNRGILIDVHGHGHAIDRIEWGYLLEGSDLRLADAMLAGTYYINESSIRRLVVDNIAASNLPQLIRGTYALGTLLANSGYPSVPSASDVAPQSTESYFSGGFITDRYGSHDNSSFDAVQMETHYTGLRNNTTNRAAFGTAFATAIQTFMNQHYYANVPCGASVLPIDLLDFKATATPEGNRLTWLLGNNKDIQNIEIQKSTNGRDFPSLSILDKNAVDVLDKTPFLLTYYRLKINDLDGHFIFSKIISVKTGNIGGGLKISPNPVFDQLSVELPADIEVRNPATGRAEGSDFYIVNLLGQVVRKGRVVQNIDVSALPEGAYFLKVGTEQVKFVKQ